MMFRKVVLALVLGLLSSPASANQWILDNFAGLPVTTGALTGNHVVVYPSLVRDATCVGGYSCIQVVECNLVWSDPVGGYACEFPPNYADQRIAFMNVTAGGQSQNGQFGQSIFIDGDPYGRNDQMDVFMSKVTVSPNWPPFVDFGTTNLDALVFEAVHYTPVTTPGRGKHVYLEDVTVSCPDDPAGSCWSDAALDIKPTVLQANRLRTDGGGLNTLKMWGPGPHYIVNSTINNSRYANAAPVVGEGGLVSTGDCSLLVLNIYNSTFNGSPTLPVNKIGCWDGGTPTINYLTVDPTTTGEMHAMFGVVAPPPPPPTTYSSIIAGSGGNLVIGDTWTFGTDPIDGYGNYLILLNSAGVSEGYGSTMVKHNGMIYKNANEYGGWHVWNGSTFVLSVDPR